MRALLWLGRLVLLVAVALVAAGCTATASNVHTAEPIDLSPVPSGRLPVAYGDAEISVPKTWMVLDYGLCGGPHFPPLVQLGWIRNSAGCNMAPPTPQVAIVPLNAVPAA